MDFEWDEAKEVRNVRQHGVDFEEASSTFYDPLALLLSDEGHSDEELRFILLGRSRRGRLLVTSSLSGARRFGSSLPATRHRVR